MGASVADTTQTVKSLEDCALSTTPPSDLFLFLKDLWGTQLQQTYWPAVLTNTDTAELTRLSKTLEWNHPSARAMEF